MLEEINKVLLNNAGQRLTPELINGMAHSIRLIYEQYQTEGEYIPSEPDGE